MAKGDKPIKVVREENISVTVWENEKKSGDGTYRTIQIEASRPTPETKDLPKGDKNKKYLHDKIKIGYRQRETLVKMLNSLVENNE